MFELEILEKANTHKSAKTMPAMFFVTLTSDLLTHGPLNSCDSWLLLVYSSVACCPYCSVVLSMTCHQNNRLPPHWVNPVVSRLYIGTDLPQPDGMWAPLGSSLLYSHQLTSSLIPVQLMLFATESQNYILLSHLKPAADAFALLWLRLWIHGELCVYCRELTTILSVFGREKFTASITSQW